MEMWFSELHTSNVKLSMRIEEQLCSVESDCQRIDVLAVIVVGHTGEIGRDGPL